LSIALFYTAYIWLVPFVTEAKVICFK